MFTACGTKHRRCCLLVTNMRWNSVPPHVGHQQRASSVHYTTNCKHSLVLLRMGEIITPKHVELIEIMNKIIIVASIWLFISLYQ